jgi:RNA polymerase sigma factor (sigma-70 family)
MATAPPHPLIRHLRRLAGARLAAELPDAHLLARFAAAREEAAFAALVQRHGPLVLGVCRRVLRDGHAAEDAFQEVFLLLARRAGSLRDPDRLGPWLFGVAYRTALKARGRTARRRACERQAAAPAVGAADDLVWRDLRPVLDEAVAGLPERYRAAFVLHYLQGVRVEEVARRLGCPRGTVATRLTRARALLRKGLARRGVSLTAAAMAAALTAATVSASVPAALRMDTARAAVAHAALTGAGLIQGGLMMVTTKLKAAALLLLGLGLAAGGGAALSGTASHSGGRAEAKGAGPQATARAEVPEGDLILFLDGSTHFFRAEYRAAARDFDRLARRHPDSRFAPDACGLAVCARELGEGKATDAQADTKGRARIRKSLDGIAPAAMQGGEGTDRPAPDVRAQQAEKDFAVAEFYRRTAHPGAACFYYELVSRRYPGTAFASRAAERLRTLRKKAGETRETEGPAPARVGRVFINGNDRQVPNALILYQLGLRPGEVLTYPALSGAESNLRALRGVTATLSVIEADAAAAFKDVLVQVEEPQPAARPKALTLAELQRIARANSPLLREVSADVQAAYGAVTQAGAGSSERRVAIGQLRDAKLRVSRIANELSKQVRSAYEDVMAARKQVALSQEQARGAAETFTAAKKEVQAAEVSPAALDTLRQALIKAQQARGALEQARGVYGQAWRQLAITVGLPSLPPTDLTDDGPESGADPRRPTAR